MTRSGRLEIWIAVAIGFAVLGVGCSRDRERSEPANSVHPAAPAVSDEPAAPPRTQSDESAEVDEEERLSFRDIGLDWLVRHQFDDGRWQFDHSPRASGPTSGAARARSNMAATGLAALAFQANSYGKRPPDRHVRALEWVLNWIVDHKQADGGLVAAGDDLRDTAHAVATTAVCEAFREFQDRRWERVGRGAVEFSIKRQQPNGGWPGGDGDGDEEGSLEAATWHLHAVATARAVGLDVTSELFRKGRGFLELLRAEGGRARFNEAAGSGESSYSDDRRSSAMEQ